MTSGSFETAIAWLREERDSYQTTKFDYEGERERTAASDVDYWIQQLNSYLQRIPLFGLDTPPGQQSVAKLAATAVALFEQSIAGIGLPPAPGHPSGEIEKWQRDADS